MPRLKETLLPGGARIDRLDRAVVERLRVGGRESNRSLARALGISEATVGSRLRRMEEANVVRVIALTDLEALGYPFLAILHLRVGDRSVTDVGTDLAALPETIAASLTSGPFGVIAAIVACDGRSLADILGKTIPRNRGIEDVRCELALDVLRFESTWAMLGAPPPSAQLTNGGGALDELDLAIVHAMQQAARTSYRRIAAQVGVSEGTVRVRLGRMEAERLVRFQAVCDVEAFEMTAGAYVGIQVQDGRIDEVAGQLLACGEISVLMRTLGDFHFVAVVQAPSRESLIDTIISRIAAIPGVRRTDTSEIWRLLKHSYSLTRIV